MGTSACSSIFDARKKIGFLNYLKLDVGVFNGQGINATGDFDNHKDFIGRLAFKPYHVSKKVIISAGTSILYGALFQNTKYRYFTGIDAGVKTTLVDSANDNVGKNSPRHYYGADVQLKFKNRKGFIKYGMQYGYNLFPSYTFNENKMFHFCLIEDPSSLDSVSRHMI